MSGLEGKAPRVIVTGSIAFDYLMSFPGRFVDVIVPDRMDRISVSFLVDEMRRVPGGVGANIAYGMALLGVRPHLMATAGRDAADYKAWLAAEGVDVSLVAIEEDVFTASFFVSTDLDQNQIATFYAGAMARATRLSFHDVDRSALALAIVSPNDPGAMTRYAAECRKLGIPFVFDPSQQVARLSAEELLGGLEGAEILIGNDYEFGVLEKKTGLSESGLLARVPVVVVTHGENGSTIHVRAGGEHVLGVSTTHRIPPARLRTAAIDPTGVGDAYRAGLLAARLRGLSWDLAGKVGSIAAVYGLESLGPQPPRYTLDAFLSRFGEEYGVDEGAIVSERLRAPD
jgi:adenosine kinase